MAVVTVLRRWRVSSGLKGGEGSSSAYRLGGPGVADCKG